MTADPTIDLARLASDAVPGAVVERLRGARHVLAVTHEHPDADTLGAVLGVCLLVEAMGGRATAVSSDEVPPLYGFLRGMDRFVRDPEPGGDYDLLVLADCANPTRVGEVARRHPEPFATLPRVTIDHHASNDSAGDGDWIDPAAAATCEMVALLAVALGQPLDLADGVLADALTGGIVMDTATFAHPNATPRTFEVAGALVQAGASLSDISNRLYRTKPEAQIRLFGRVLDRLQSTSDGRIAWSTLWLEDLQETGAIGPHSEGIIDLITQSETAEVAMLLKEQDDGTTRLSVRTKPGGVDATVLTGVFGGGGHPRASGASLAMPPDEAAAAVIAEAERLVAAVRR
jgi:phosphoesterase RecJ-like protein